jgi:hypothetical protein
MKTKKKYFEPLTKEYRRNLFSYVLTMICLLVSLSNAFAQITQNPSPTYSTHKTAVQSPTSATVSAPSVNENTTNSAKELTVLQFYTSEGININTAKRFAYHNGWKLATAEEIEYEWQHNKLHFYKYGLVEDGRIAVPIQKEIGLLKTGTNIGLETDQVNGFFYYSNEQ